MTALESMFKGAIELVAPFCFGFRKIFTPATIDEPRDVLAHNQLIGKRGLFPRVNHYRRLIREMMPHDSRLSGVDVAGRFKPRPR